MKNILVVTFSLLAFFSCSKAPKPIHTAPEFLTQHGAALLEQSKVSSYLVNYDKLAWQTSDTLMKYEKNNFHGKVGAEWFGYQKGSQMLFVYGKFEDNKYLPFVRYTIAEDLTIQKTDVQDSTIEYRYAKAINTVYTEAVEIMKNIGHSFNSYVYTDSLSKTIRVHYLPALGDHFEIVYGNEFSFTLDSTASQVLARTSSKNPLQYFMLDSAKDVMIFNDTEGIPDIGFLYTAERWFHSSKGVLIKTPTSLFRLVKNDNGLAWIVIAE